MKTIITRMLFCLVATFSLPNIALAAQCWCTCTSGYRDCDNLDAQSCARKDASLSYCSCSWSAAGYCPYNLSDKYNQLNKIVPVNEQPETKSLESEAMKEIKALD